MGMKIVFATPLYPPDVGGPATYAKALAEEFKKHGITVSTVVFSRVAKRFPKGISHVIYFFKLLNASRHADAIMTFDTWSAGLPALWAARLRHKKLIIRIGGDYLWEEYLNRTHDLIPLSKFYKEKRELTHREQLYFRAAREILQYADTVFFNTAWQLRLWQDMYGFEEKKVHVLENYFPRSREVSPAKNFDFVLAVRETAFKNIPAFEKAFSNVQKDHPDIFLDRRLLSPDEHKARMRNCYVVVISSVSEINANTLIDAVYYGKPFIAPIDSGMNEALRNAGLFVDTTKSEEMERVIRTLLDPEKYKEAIEKVKNCTFSHSWEEIADEVLRAIK